MRTSFFLSLCLVASIQSACLPDQCEDASANLELTIAFSGFSLSNARRVEFETEVDAPGVTSSTGFVYLERRLGSIAYPSGLPGQITYRVHTGTYVNHLEGTAHGFRVIVRVYGQREGHADALLAEGQKRWDGLKRTGCYLDQRMKVSPSPTCAMKVEGDPCVSPSQNWQPRGVCQMSSGSLTCLPSSCGDGFTDRRRGEICDPGNDSREPCTADCLSRVREVRVGLDDDRRVFVEPAAAGAKGSVVGFVTGLTESPGIWTLDATDLTVPGDLHGSLLVADVDADGADELFLGLPGATFDRESPPPDCTLKPVGVVYGYDYPMTMDFTFGGKSRQHVRVNGPCQARSTKGASFGAAMAAGDIDGDGAPDLVVGAPRADGRDGRAAGGRVYVLFGGTNNALPHNPETVLLVDDATQIARSFLGDAGADTSPELPGDFLGYALAVADFDLDGYADIAVAAPQLKSPALGRRGGVYLIRGGPDFRDRASGAPEVGSLASFQVEAGFERDRVRFGVSLAVGDVNGDGFPDLIMGSTSGDSRERAGVTHEGGVSVLFGSESFFERSGASSTMRVFTSNPSAERDLVSVDVLALGGDPGTGLRALLRGLGGTVAAVDLDGDGRHEVIATLGRAPLGDADGVVAVLRGTYFERLQALLPTQTPPPPTASELTLILGPDDADFGLTLGAVDVSGDRRQDLLVGAPKEAFVAPPEVTDPVLQAGAVYALLATSLGSWFAPSGATDPLTLDLLTLREAGAPAEEDPPIGLIWLRGTLSHGRFGTAMAGSSHLAQSNYEMKYRNAYTYIFEPGHPTASGIPAAGRIWSFFLPGLLPCESLATCVP